MNSFKRALITGANGSLARGLIAAAPAGTTCIALTRLDLDISDGEAVALAIKTAGADIVINGAAYNLVDKAEGEGMDDALRINALGVGKLAAACREAGIPLAHFSTDFVFDGHRNTPYSETDLTAPLGVYGASKLAGENMALAADARNWAIRVCRLFGPIPEDQKTQKPAGNFPLLMLKLARERGKVRVVNDQLGTPTYIPDLAPAIWRLLATPSGGLFQLSNEGEVGFHDYARETLSLARVKCEIEEVSSEAYGAAAKRPLYSVMSNAKAYSQGVEPLRSWNEALREFIEGL